MSKRVICLICVFSFLLMGCTAVKNYSGIRRLQEYSDNQDEIKKYVEQQEELFNKLLDTVKNNQLASGESKENIITEYGEPVLFNKIDDGSGRKEELLYRHPVEYFSSDKIYLYFDDSQNLVSMEYQPFESQE